MQIMLMLINSLIILETITETKLSNHKKHGHKYIDETDVMKQIFPCRF